MTCKMSNRHIPQEQNSWYLRVGLMDHFFCKCGCTDKCLNIITKIAHPKHICSGCSNHHYLDSVMFLHSKKITRWSTFYWNIQTTKTKKYWEVQVFISIPIFDYVSQKIQFKKIGLATTTLNFDGTYAYSEEHSIIMQKYIHNSLKTVVPVKEYIDIALEENLSKFVLEKPTDSIKWIKEEALSKYTYSERLKLYSFYLKYTHLQEYDFFHWDAYILLKNISKKYNTVETLLSYIFNHREDIALKEAYLHAYRQSMKINACYNPKFDYIFARHIKNNTLLISLIQMDTKIKHMIFNESHLVVIEAFLTFLSKYYTEREIGTLFISLEPKMDTAKEVFLLFHINDKNHVQEQFKKLPLSFKNLQQEFTRMQKVTRISYRQKTIFEHNVNDLNAEITKGIFRYQLPKTTEELKEWGNILNNCCGGYSKEIHQKAVVVFAVFKENTLYCTLVIRGCKIANLLAKHHNHIIIKKDKQEIDTWLKEIYISSWIR